MWGCPCSPQGSPRTVACHPQYSSPEMPLLQPIPPMRTRHPPPTCEGGMLGRGAGGGRADSPRGRRSLEASQSPSSSCSGGPRPAEEIQRAGLPLPIHPSSIQEILLGHPSGLRGSAQCERDGVPALRGFHSDGERDRNLELEASCPGLAGVGAGRQVRASCSDPPEGPRGSVLASWEPSTQVCSSRRWESSEA